MPRQNPHVSIFAWHLSFPYLVIDEQALSRSDLQMKGVSHLVPLPDGGGSALHPFGGFEYVIDAALHVERLFRQRIVLAIYYFFEAADGVFELDVFARAARELFRDVKGLRQKALNAARAGDNLF